MIEVASASPPGDSNGASVEVAADIAFRWAREIRQMLYAIPTGPRHRGEADERRVIFSTGLDILYHLRQVMGPELAAKLGAEPIREWPQGERAAEIMRRVEQLPPLPEQAREMSRWSVALSREMVAAGKAVDEERSRVLRHLSQAALWASFCFRDLADLEAREQRRAERAGRQTSGRPAPRRTQPRQTKAGRQA